MTWHYTLSHPGATYIAPHFADFDLGDGDYLIVSDPNGSQAYTLRGRGKMEAGAFWGRHIKGDTVELELVQFASDGGRGFTIDEYAAGYADLSAPEARSICGADDKKNAKCYQSTNSTEYATGRPVARLLIAGNLVCTGWLVSADGLLLTNEHCITNAAGALNTDYEFMSEAPLCASANCQLCYPGTIYDGATFLQDDPGLDYCLVRVNGNPAATHGFLEMDNRAAVVGEQIYIVQHPDGRAKEFAYNSTNASDSGGVCHVNSVTQSPCSGGGYNDVGYYCDTEGGSSGSPVIAMSTHKVVALHHCADCPNRAVPMRLIYPLVAPFLLPSPAGVVQLDRAEYGCAGKVKIELRDGSLAGAGSQSVPLVSSNGDSETVTLTEIGGATAVFVGSIGLAAGGAVGSDGVMEVVDGDSVTVTYLDEIDGAGGANVLRTDSAEIDCAPPPVLNVSALGIGPHVATIRTTSDVPVTAKVTYGTACAARTMSAEAAVAANPVDVALAGLADDVSYYYAVEIADEAGNVAISDNGGACYSFTTPAIQDFFSELFVPGGNDLHHNAITYTPTPSADFYAGCTQPIVALPTDPAGGVALPMPGSDVFATVTLPVGVTVPFYGVGYDHFYVGANGYITFDAGDTDATESYADHFARVRIAPLFDDLNPSASGGGTVSWKMLADRVAVTWLNVPEAPNSGANTFQVELFFGGTVRMSYLTLSATDGLAGLSQGLGVSPEFAANDLSALAQCGPQPPHAAPAAALTHHNVPVGVILAAYDDGLPAPLSFVIVSLPAGALRDPATDLVITASDLPYTLANGGNVVTFQGQWGGLGNDSFTYRANDGGITPSGGDSNEAIATITLAPRPAVPVESWNLSSDPGWARDGLWAYGVPTGGGTHNHDPTSGHSGPSVLGYNLNGDYTTFMVSRYVTTGVLDCTGLDGVSLRFWRWLGVESADQAAVEMSTNGATWSVLWVNPAGAGQSIADTSWVQVAYPAGAADGEPTVRFRWRMGPSDSLNSYPGWNIDDIELLGVPPLVRGDYDGNGQIDLVDFAHAGECLSGPGTSTPTGCEGFDFDQDGDMDLQDFAAFQRSMTP